MDLKVPFEAIIGVVWKRNQRRAESKSDPTVDAQKTHADFQGEKLHMLSTLQRDKKTGGFQERQAHLIVQITKDGKTKSVGVAKLNLALFIDSKEKGGMNGVKHTMSLEKCPDKQSNVVFTMCVVADNTAGGDCVSDFGSVAGTEDGIDIDDFESLDINASDQPKGPRLGGSFSGSSGAHAIINRVQRKKAQMKEPVLPMI